MTELPISVKYCLWLVNYLPGDLPMPAGVCFESVPTVWRLLDADDNGRYQ